MLHTSPDSAEAFALQYDRHGDSYTDDVTVEKLKEVLGNVDEKVWYNFASFQIFTTKHQSRKAMKKLFGVSSTAFLVGRFVIKLNFLFHVSQIKLKWFSSSNLNVQ